jgi:hypothetical protein
MKKPSAESSPSIFNSLRDFYTAAADRRPAIVIWCD